MSNQALPLPPLDGPLSEEGLWEYFSRRNPEWPGILKYMDKIDAPSVIERDPDCLDLLQAISDNIKEKEDLEVGPDAADGAPTQEMLVALAHVCTSRSLRILDYLRRRYGEDTIEALLLSDDAEALKLRNRFETLGRRSLASRAISADRLALCLYVFDVAGLDHGQIDGTDDDDDGY